MKVRQNLFILLSLALLLAACGKKMAPISPDAVLPAAVRQFQVAQAGDGLRLSWLLPRENLLGQPLSQISGCLLYRAEAPGVAPATGCPPDFRLVADIDLAYPQVGEVQGEAVSFRDVALSPGKRYFYRVAAYYDPLHPGAWSKALSHVWGVLPRPPAHLTAQAGDRTAQLSWSHVTLLQDGSPVRDLAGYHLFRQSPKENWRRLTPEPLAAVSFDDVGLANDTEYAYLVRAVRQVGPDRLESGNSESRTVTPVDLSPPPPLLNLVAVPTPKGMELRWEPSPAPDLAGYRVYRRPSGVSQFARLTPDLIKKPYFVDSEVVRGQIYHYYVTAVDNAKRPNESAPSEEAEITF